MIDVLSKNPQSKSSIETNLIEAKFRIPQTGALTGAYSHSRRKMHDIALPRRLIPIIKYSGPTDSKFSENVFCWFLTNVPIGETVG